MFLDFYSLGQASSYRSHFSLMAVTKIWTLTGTSQKLGEGGKLILIARAFQACMTLVPKLKGSPRKIRKTTKKWPKMGRFALRKFTLFKFRMM